MIILLVALAAAGVLVLCHLAPFPFLLDAASDDVVMWEGPRERSGRKVVYLTFDDGPNPTATPSCSTRSERRGWPPRSS